MDRKDDLILHHIPARHWRERTHWRLVESIQIGDYIIPKGFVTDGASVPRFLWWLFPPHGRYMRAAVLHDYLLQESNMTRKEADWIFFCSMYEMQVARWRRIILFSAVRLWGMIKEMRVG